MEEKTREFIIDTIARAAQIIFAVLIVGPFVSGFNLQLFVLGCLIYIYLISYGIRFTKKILGRE